MNDWKEGDELPPSSIEFIVGNAKMKLTDDEKSRKFWISVIGCLNIMMLIGIGYFINLVAKISFRLSSNIAGITPWVLILLLMGLLIYVNNCCMGELNRRVPRTRRDEL